MVFVIQRQFYGGKSFQNQVDCTAADPVTALNGPKLDAILA